MKDRASARFFYIVKTNALCYNSYVGKTTQFQKECSYDGFKCSRY